MNIFVKKLLEYIFYYAMIKNRREQSPTRGLTFLDSRKTTLTSDIV